jgi:tetratricopeptide (TPR) repeat protein
MSEQTDPTPVKKRRVIHWDPEHGRATGKRRWTPLRILAWAVGGPLALLVMAGMVIRGIRMVVGPEFLRPTATAVVAAGENDASSAFVTESKASLARENVAKALAELRRMPQDHPSQLQQLILIEKAFLNCDILMDAHEYAKAYTHLTSLAREIDEFAENVKLKQVTQKAYDEIIVRMKELDRARPLAPQEFETAFANAGTGRQFFNEGRFATAKKQYDLSYAALGRAQEALKAFVDDHIRKALEAVAAGHKEAALAAFQAALEKDPTNETAQKGMKRAEVADRVHALLQQGARLEENKEYAQAKECFSKAFELDALSAVAQQGKSRNERLQKETEFNSALAEAVAFRGKNEWPKAIVAYERALKVYPDKDEVKKALKETRETAHREAVKQALAKAGDYETQTEWEQARSAYNTAMELEPKNEDAKEGYFRTGRMIRALMQYNKLVEVAEVHVQHAEFQSAIRAFNEAVATKPAYLPLTDRVTQLREVLAVQSRPVEVTFNSDGDSWVSISNYRMLGKIKTTTVKMLPGDYEIVSRRKGYQDVMIMLQVRNGATPPVVNVACSLRANG